jgi:hypothetical protein
MFPLEKDLESRSPDLSRLSQKIKDIQLAPVESKEL